MFKTKVGRSLIWLIGPLFLLQGCGDTYPEVGKFQGTQYDSAKNLSRYSTVYTLTPSSFEDWKNERSNLQDLASLTENELLALQAKFAKSQLIQKEFASYPLLTNGTVNLDEIAGEEYKLVTEQVNELKADMAKIQKEISNLQAKKEKADTAQLELSQIKNNIKGEKQKLLQNFEELKNQSILIFKQVDSVDIGSRYKPSKIVEQDRAFDYVIYEEDSKLSCKDFAVNRITVKRMQKRYQAYLYAPPLKLSKKVYCPIFKTMGSAKAQRTILAKLSEEDKNILRNAATASVTYNKLKKVFYFKQRNVNRDNPDIYQLSKSFSYRERSYLAKLTRANKKVNEQLSELVQKTKEGIRENKVKKLKSLLADVKNHYLFESLQNTLEKESIIQPDGTFTLRSGRDFYLVEVDLGAKSNPKAAQYALIRMDQFKNKELVELSSNEFFSFEDLSSISL